MELQQLLEKWGACVIGTEQPQPPNWDGGILSFDRFVEDSREVREGDAFVARVRAGSDGHQYIPQAIESGARLIIAQRPAEFPIPDGVTYLELDDNALFVAWLAAANYDFPGQKMIMIGVTGTDGKTSTANILYDILREAGLKVGLLSTIKAAFGEHEEPLALHVTTPEAPVVQRYLAQMVSSGITHCILETTSHGWAQHRVAAIPFDIGVVTNITHEHLDYHGSYEAYLEAKSRLFLSVAQNKGKENGVEPIAILNRDDQSFRPLADLSPIYKSYSLDKDEADGRAKEIVYGADSTQFDLWLGDESIRVESQLVGDFNLYNMLAASLVANHLGINIEGIRSGIQKIELIYGRMQRVNRGQQFLVVVDFAHTPNALAKAIQAGRRMIGDEGRIITVFGSAGKRDVDKRRLMAEISAQEADLTILTAEDPRTESLSDILEMMAAGCEAYDGVEGITFWRVADRGRAIYYGISLAKEKDLLLICGKGHEQSLCFGTIEYPWDDLVATERALDAFLAGEEMPDLGLPTYSESFKE